MRIAFTSSHVDRQYPDGRLVVGIVVENEVLGQTVWDEIFFEVPPDFHTHNDSVAAALMTLAGREFSEVSFNFPISTFCAEMLRRYYGAIAIGPVDCTCEPRRKGRRIGLLFSGGVDSTATWLLLTRLLGDDFAVITSEYGGHHEFEARGYGSYRRDVSCRTDLRRDGWNRVGRFNYAVPLLFAEYLDLGSVCTGHTISHAGTHFGSPRHGSPETWTFQDLMLQAGGLDELHLLRSLSVVAAMRLLMHYGRDRIVPALHGTELPGHPKRYTKELIFRIFFEDAGLKPPPELRRIAPLRGLVRLGTVEDRDLRVLYLLKRGRIEDAQRICPDYTERDLALVSTLSLAFLERYSPTIVELLPQPLRSSVVAIFQECGIYPYDTRDWHEVEIVYDFLQSAGARRRVKAA